MCLSPPERKDIPRMTRFVVGAMTGTSLDGLDACLVAISGQGLDISTTIVRGVGRSFPPELASSMRRIASEGEAMTAGQISQLTREFSLFHIEVIRDLLCGDKADLIAVHGQTVYHSPPCSWQMISPTLLSHEFQTTVVFDLRAADLAAVGRHAWFCAKTHVHSEIAMRILFKRQTPLLSPAFQSQ